MTRTRVYRALERCGPMTRREIVDNIKCTPMAVSKALGALVRLGIVERTGGNTWLLVYRIRKGAPPPDDMRGQHPNSRVVLNRATKDVDWWQPCELANLLRFPLGGTTEQE